MDWENMIWAPSYNGMVAAAGRHATIFIVRRSRPKGSGNLLNRLGLFVLILIAVISESTITGFCEENKRWSFAFKNSPISEVLDELCRTTGIDIISNQLPTDKVVTKHYEDETIDDIIKDLFKGSNFALVWNRGEDGKDTVDVWILDGGGGGQSASLPRIDRPVSRVPATLFERRVPVPFNRQEDAEETNDIEEDVDESPAQVPEPDEESEKEDVGSDEDSNAGSVGDARNQPGGEPQDEPGDESDEGTEAETSPAPITPPGVE